MAGSASAAGPAGAYVIRNGDVTWRPAVDPNRIVAVIGLVLGAWLVSRPRVIRARAKAQPARHGDAPHP